MLHDRHKKKVCKSIPCSSALFATVVQSLEALKKILSSGSLSYLEFCINYGLDHSFIWRNQYECGDEHIQTKLLPCQILSHVW